MEKHRIYGVSTKEETDREREHRAIARRAATDGIVLLKNDGALPLKTKKVALYGAGARMTVMGGSGSGDTHARVNVNVETGLKNAGIEITSTAWLNRFESDYNRRMSEWKKKMNKLADSFSPIRTMDMFNAIHEHHAPQPGSAPVLESDLDGNADTAIYVLARQAGEGGDRKCERGDYLLSVDEEESLALLSGRYKKLILIINAGSPVDLSVLDKVRIDALVFMGQGGMESGNALTDILTGKINPSGKLVDTWAYNYGDYPCADTFSHINGKTDFEEYREGIYVGYRYFDSFGVKPRFAFGFGLSYTEFTHEVKKVSANGTEVSVDAEVKNLGTVSGKEIIQLYIKKPHGRLGCEEKTLVAFAKTKLLEAGEAQTLSLRFDLTDFASFDENEGAFLLEKGEYGLFFGNSSETLSPCALIVLNADAITERTSAKLRKPDFEDIKSHRQDEIYDDKIARIVIDAKSINTLAHQKYKPEFDEKIKETLARISDKDKISLVVGGGYKINCFVNVMGAAGRTSTNLLRKGIPNIVLSDGPAGLNVNQSSTIMPDGTPRYPDGLPEDWQWGWLKKIAHLSLLKPPKNKGRTVYCYMTAFPCATLQAQSWDTELLEEIGRAVGREMLEIGVSVWLAPGMNIHRNPLCGRNFEYYSEDPLIAGKMAAAVTRGVQSNGGVGVSIKHFCCNNQEENRMMVSENLSPRAMREIYLKAFRIAIREGKPWTVMSSYNKINGLHVVNDRELLTTVLRDEWGFDGLVMSDWNAVDQCSYAEAINSGNDLIMPGTKAIRKAFKKALADGSLDKDALDTAASKVLKMVYSSATSHGF